MPLHNVTIYNQQQSITQLIYKLFTYDAKQDQLTA